MTALTHHNAALARPASTFPRAEGFTFKGADGDEVAGWLVKPPGFDPTEEIPGRLPDPRRPARGLARRVA